jgi:hypothetical protein
LNMAKDAPVEVDQTAPLIAEEAAPIVAAPIFQERVAPVALPRIDPIPVAEARPLFNEKAAHEFAERAAQAFAEKATPVVAAQVAPLAAAQVAPVAALETEAVSVPEIAPVAAWKEVAHAEKDTVVFEAPSRLNPLRGLLFSVGLRNLNRAKAAAAVEDASVAPIARAPIESEQERTVISRTFTQFAEPVAVSVPVVTAEPVAPPVAVVAPVVETPVESAPERAVTAAPEFLPPREFVPVREPVEERASSPSTGWSRGNNPDELRTLPSRRGQYKR